MLKQFFEEKEEKNFKFLFLSLIPPLHIFFGLPFVNSCRIYTKKPGHMERGMCSRVLGGVSMGGGEGGRGGCALGVLLDEVDGNKFESTRKHHFSFGFPLLSVVVEE